MEKGSERKIVVHVINFKGRDKMQADVNNVIRACLYMQLHIHYLYTTHTSFAVVRS